MEERDFIKKIGALKETAILQGGFIREEQIAESFPELSEQQKGVLTAYFKENHIGIGEALPDSELLAGEDGDHIRMYLEELEELMPLDEDKKRVLIMAAMNGDKVAREQVTASYLKNVVDMARLYTGQGVEVADLIGEGNVALAAAMNMMGSMEQPEDCDAMVSRTIMNAMEELIRAENDEMEAQQHSMAVVMKALGKAKELSEELRRKVSVAEFVEETGMSEEELQQAFALSKELSEYIAL